VQERTLKYQIGQDHSRQQVERLQPLDAKQIGVEKRYVLEWQHEYEREKDKSITLRGRRRKCERIRSLAVIVQNVPHNPSECYSSAAGSGRAGEAAHQTAALYRENRSAYFRKNALPLAKRARSNPDTISRPSRPSENRGFRQA